MSMTPIGSSSLLCPNSTVSRVTPSAASRRLLILGEAEAAREAILQRLPATGEAGIGHEILVGIERLLALGQANALRGAVREDAPALLVVLEVCHHDLVQDLLVHGGI